MSEVEKKLKLAQTYGADEATQEGIKSGDPSVKAAADPAILTPQEVEELDEEEAEFRAMRRDLPGTKGASAAGIVTIGVTKAPPKNEFFRTEPSFRPILPMVDIELGMEKQYFAVAKNMVEPLGGIGITVTDHTLYFTVTSRGAHRLIPVRTADAEGSQNEYSRTKEIAMIQGMTEWVRMFTDQEDKCYRVFPAPVGRFGEPQFPELKHAKIIRLAFRDKGCLIDSTEHPLFLKWAARDHD